MISKHSACVFAFRGDTLLPSMVPFPVIKLNLKIMALINAAPVSVSLEVARLVSNLKLMWCFRV